MWLEHLAELSGKEKKELAGISEHQPFRLAAIHEHLKAIGDPDAEVFGGGVDTFQAGVPLGVEGMPWVPEVFEAKVKWRKYDPTSAVENASAVQQQFRKEQEMGAMVEVEELDARKEYGDRLRVAALAALEKSDHSFRVVHDATHGVGVNSKIKVEDQLRYPGPAEIKMALQSLMPATFVLAAGVSRAHRLVKVKRADWGLHACKTGVDDAGLPSSKVWLNTVGTFGVIPPLLITSRGCWEGSSDAPTPSWGGGMSVS